MPQEQVNAEFMADAVVLRDFLHTDYWRVFRKYIEAAVEDNKTRLLEFSASNELLRYWQGVANGKRDILFLPEAIIQEATERARNQ